MNLDKLIILNDCEKPCAYLVCRELPNGKIQYINKKLRKEYGLLRKGRGASTLGEFGFIEIEKNKFKLFYVKEDSIAKYHDGRPRYWQGLTEFTYNEILNMKRID